MFCLKSYLRALITTSAPVTIVFACCRLLEDGPCFRVVPDDLLHAVKQQLRSCCERLVWTLDPDVLSHAECLLCLLVVLSRSFLALLYCNRAVVWWL